MTETAAPQGSQWLRYTVLALAGLEVALFLWIELDFLLRSPGMDMLTRSMNRDFSLIAIVPFALFTLPALALAIIRRWLWLALALAIVPLLLLGALFAMFAAH
jgi:hypothetical protein